MSPVPLRRRVKNALRALLIDTPFLPGPRPEAAAFHEERDDASPGDSTCPTDSIAHLQDCPVCGSPERTVVNEYNKLILHGWLPDAAAARYDYALCHACGIVYASRRPMGPRYAWLFDRFELAIHRPAKDDIGNLLASTSAVTPEDRAELRRRAARGVFVSDHLRLGRKEYLPTLLADRLLVSAHAEVLGSLLDLRGARVLEVRSRVGSLGAILQRLYGADVSTMAFFERQRVVIEEAYGLPARARIDFDRFAIPYDGEFDVIVANHMFTHAVRPREFLATLRSRLRPGGHLYLYNEPDDAEYLEPDGQSMINRLNPFHLQAFDGPSLGRALAANGFEVLFLARYQEEFICLCRVRPAPADVRMSPKERDRRLRHYQRARDAAILMLPADRRALFADEWDAVTDRAFAAGIAEVGERGEVRMRRRLRKRRAAADGA